MVIAGIALHSFSSSDHTASHGFHAKMVSLLSAVIDGPTVHTCSDHTAFRRFHAKMMSLLGGH